MLIAALLLRSALAEPVDLTVTSDLGELDAAVREQVTTRVENVATDLGHELSSDADHSLTIDVDWIEGSTTDFLVTLSASYRSTTLEPARFECRECSATELLDRTEARARESLEELFERASMEPEEQPSPPPAALPLSPPPAPQPRKKLGGLGWGGVASLSVGVASVVTGGVLVSLGQARLESDPTNLRDFRPPGYVTLGVGGAALVTGTILLVLDRKHARTDATATRSIAPTPSGFQIRF